MSPADPEITLRYANSIDEIDTVEALWNALQEHHVRITPELDPQTPKRELADAWRIRRSKYVRWLEDPEPSSSSPRTRAGQSRTWRSPRQAPAKPLSAVEV